MDDLLGSLSADILQWVEDLLSQQDLPDTDLKALFIRYGLTEAQVSRALSYRRLYLLNVFREGYTPIRKGDQALRFDPRTLNFVPLKR